jgi:hypothetical protein
MSLWPAEGIENRRAAPSGGRQTTRYMLVDRVPTRGLFANVIFQSLTNVGGMKRFV